MPEDDLSAIGPLRARISRLEAVLVDVPRIEARIADLSQRLEALETIEKRRTAAVRQALDARAESDESVRSLAKRLEEE